MSHTNCEFVGDVNLAYGGGAGGELDANSLDWADLLTTYRHAVDCIRRCVPKTRHIPRLRSARQCQGYTLPTPRTRHLPLIRASSIITDQPVLALDVTALGSEIVMSRSLSSSALRISLPGFTFLMVK